MVCGACIGLLGLAVVFAAMNIPALMGERLPSKALPLLCGALTAAGGFLLAIKAYRYAGEEIPMEWPDRSGWISLGVTMAALIAYIALIEVLGLPVASMFFVIGLVRYLGMGLLAGVATGLGTAVSIYLMIHYLALSFPLGVLGS